MIILKNEVNIEEKLDVLIGVVTYNSRDVIKETILSVLKYTNGINFKMVIYDNYSTDDTLSVVESVKTKRIEIVRGKRNNGFGYGNNRIFNGTKAKYYLALNPDIRIRSNVIKKIFDYMEENKSIGMISPKVCYPNGELQYLCKKDPTVFDLFIRRFIPGVLKKCFQKRYDDFEMKYTNYDHAFLIPYVTGCFMFFREEIFSQIGGFDEKFFLYLEDADISRRANAVAPCIYFPDETVYHLWGRGSHRSIRKMFITIQSACYYFTKWGWKFW